MPRWFQCLFSRNLLLDSLKGTFVDFNIKNTIVRFLICSSLIKSYSVHNPVAVGETRHWSRIQNLSKPSSHRRHWWNFGAVPKVKSETSSSTQGFSKMGWQWLSQSYHWLASFLFKYARFLQLCSPEGALPEKWVRVFAALKTPFSCPPGRSWDPDCSIFVLPELGSERDYVITHSVCSVYIRGM